VGSPEPADESATAETPARIDPSVLREAAIRELEGMLASESPRLQRLAGMALARIAHEGAIETLSRLQKEETSDLRRIDIAYGLALAGREQGRHFLVEQTRNKRRDVRIDAARRLIQLGDDSGRKALVQMLGIRSHRIGAAAELALLDDERGIEVLEKTLRNKKSSSENKMRAAVALGRAGHESARDELASILADGQYVVDAAGALAALGDELAVPALEKQLGLAAMRVSATESLRQMHREIDLQPLATALASADEEGRVTAAEAILIATAEDEVAPAAPVVGGAATASVEEGP
jgi:HEAT repeat protein